MSANETSAWPARRVRGSSNTTISSGFLLAAAGSSTVLLNAEQTVDFGVLSPKMAFAAAFILMGSAALVILKWPFWGRSLASVTVLGMFGAHLPAWLLSPGPSLFALIVVTLGLLLLWDAKMFSGVDRTDIIQGDSAPDPQGHLKGAAFASVASWMFWIERGAPSSLLGLFAVSWATFVALVFGLRTAARFLASDKGRARLIFALYASSALAGLALHRLPFWVVTLGVFLALFASHLLQGRQTGSVAVDNFWEPLLGHPERLFVGTFALLSALGAALISLPVSAARGHQISGLDALFTSTSAVCVTGLVTIDTPVELSFIGQGIVLVLIQTGGLGIMTFSTAVLWALGRRMSLRHEGAVASLISTRDRGRLFATARRILVLTGVVEVLGALVLALLFARDGDEPRMALWRGLFTSVSAFCNAGFALQSDSLVAYQTNPLVLHTVGVLIVLGGLSPLAIFAVPPLMKRSVLPVPAQAKLCLVAAAVLLFSGFVLILGFEWQDSLGNLSILDKVHNAWFQSVTLRTAGFNSVDLTLIQPATLTLSLIMMFIGGSPGGTAGGVKTTTVAILLLSVVQTIRGRDGLEVFGKSMPERILTRSAVVLTVAAVTGALSMFAIQLTQQMPLPVAVFEVFSALGTVGLTIGGTSMLDGVGKIIIIVCMFVGRVGGLTLLMFLSVRSFVPKVGRPEEDVDVG